MSPQHALRSPARTTAQAADATLPEVTPAAATPAEPTPTEAPPATAVRVEGVHVAYRRRRVLHGVDLTLDRGRVHGLVGPNGAGKSTLLRAMSGMIPLRDGTVRSEGEDVCSLQSRERARRIAFLPQDTHVEAGLRVDTVVGLGRYAHHGLPPACRATSPRRTVTWSMRPSPEWARSICGSGGSTASPVASASSSSSPSSSRRPPR